MRKRVHIETTISSFYFETRSEPEMTARREWTRRWWDDAGNSYELVTSKAVIEELSLDEFPAREDCLKLVDHIPVLQIEPAITEIVQNYLTLQVMPRSPVGDAPTWPWRRTIVVIS